MNCLLRKTEIELLDGVKYVFRALPLTLKTIELVQTLMEGEDLQKAKALIELVAHSLSYDNDPETINSLLDNGIMPITGDDGSKEKEILDKIMGALMAQFSK